MQRRLRPRAQRQHLQARVEPPQLLLQAGGEAQPADTVPVPTTGPATCALEGPAAHTRVTGL